MSDASHGRGGCEAQVRDEHVSSLTCGVLQVKWEAASSARTYVTVISSSAANHTDDFQHIVVCIGSELHQVPNPDTCR